MTEAQTFRPTATRLFGLLALLFGAVGMIAVLVLETDVRTSPLDMVIGGYVLGSLTWMCWVAGVRPAVAVRMEDVLVRNPFTDWTVPFGAIERAELGDGGVSLHLSDGREIHIFIFVNSLISVARGRRKEVLFVTLVNQRLASVPKHGLSGQALRRSRGPFLALLGLLSIWPCVVASYALLQL